MSVLGMPCCVAGHRHERATAQRQKIELFRLPPVMMAAYSLSTPSISHITSLGRPGPASVWRCRMQVDVKGKRAEERKRLKVGGDLCTVHVRTPAHSGVTDNVSSHGARVLTSKALKSNERLTVRSMLGSYRSRARVVYCVPADGGLYAIGLQLYASAGDWVSPE